MSSHRRTHALLLLDRLLSLRPGTSPLTLVLDSLEQSSRPLVGEYVRRSQTLRPPAGVSHTIAAHRRPFLQVQQDVLGLLDGRPALIIIDTLHPLIRACAEDPQTSLATSLAPLLSRPEVSLLATFHTDVPLPPTTTNPYSPSPLALLTYLATTLIRVAPLSHQLAALRAQRRALPPPIFGLAEERAGVLVSRDAQALADVYLDIEHRRRSGRPVGVQAVLTHSILSSSGRAQSITSVKTSASIATVKASVSQTSQASQGSKVVLYEEHPLYLALLNETVPAYGTTDDQTAASSNDQHVGATFSLELTDKQRQDRANVVLPHYDAQKALGHAGAGGRILYEMGSVDFDDWDDEEDEI